MVSIDLGIRFHGVEIGDADETIEPEGKPVDTRVSDKVGKQAGDVVQLVRTLPCHGRGREFESRRPRHSFQTT